MRADLTEFYVLNANFFPTSNIHYMKERLHEVAQNSQYNPPAYGGLSVEPEDTSKFCSADNSRVLT